MPASFDKTQLFDTIIIGGGGAACSAAIYSVRAGLNTLLVTESFGGQLMLTDSIENYPGIIKESGFDMASKLENHVRSYKDLKIIQGEKVFKIKKDEGKFKIITESKKELKGKTIIIATGKIPRKLNIVNAEKFEGNGIHYCGICDGPLYKGKTMAIIGGGYSGVEEAVFLSGISSKIFLIHNQNELGGEAITKKQVMDLVKQGKVEIIYNALAQEIVGDKTVTGLKYKDSKSGKIKEIKADAIFVQIGQTSNTDFIDFVNKNEIKELIIDKKNMCSEPGIFAAGDVSDIRVKQLVISCAEGAKAALSVVDYLKKK